MSCDSWQKQGRCHPEKALRENIYWPLGNTSTCVCMWVCEREGERDRMCVCLCGCVRVRVRVYIYWPPAATSGEEPSKC